ncbi:hypothetical protein OPV22_007356 [Ensete ventricosum]|uniref:Uncharacterized protein n=1 Tax=Ensete ventricosum TaxID=4639 RepID=A0AAV8RH40_ENSVE|nr:hypothetical protein OPV22_007356 [Ensete ventricosum]
MGSRFRPPGLSLAPVEEGAEASMPPPPLMANPSSSAGLAEHKVQLIRTCQSPKDMSNKENVSTIGEDGLDVSSFSKVESVQKMSKKSGRCNLRKSLAWNQAFLTEEGVLDPLELSILGGSSMKQKESVLSVINGQLSPLLGFHKSDATTPCNAVGQKTIGKMRVQSGGRKLKDSNLIGKLDASIQEEQQELMVSGIISSSKRTTKTMPRLPAASSYPLTFLFQKEFVDTYYQRGVASSNAANPTSKIPKFMPTKSHAASLTATPRDEISTPKDFTLDQRAMMVYTEQNSSVRCIQSNMRNQSACAQSSKSSAVNSHRPLGTTISCYSSKESSSYPSKAYHAAGGALAPGHAKPSALRMPSPSLGFFQQGKRPSYCPQPQLNVQPLRPTIPCIRASNVRPTEESRLLPPSTWQKSLKGLSAPESFAGTIIACKMENSSAAISLPSSNGNLVHPSTRENVSKMQRESMAIGASGRLSDSQTSGQQALKRYQSLIDDDFAHHQVLSSGNPEPNVDKQVPFVSGSVLKMNNKLLVHESRLPVVPLKVSEDVHHTCLPTKVNHACKTELSQASSLCKLNADVLDEGASELDNKAKRPLSEFTGWVAHAVSEQGGLAARNSNSLTDQEVGISSRFVDFSALTKSPLRWSKNKVLGSGSCSSSESGCSLAQETCAVDDSEINHVTRISSEETMSCLTSSKEHMAGSDFISNTDIDCSAQNTVIHVEKENLGTNNLAARVSSFPEDPQPTASTDSKCHDSRVCFDNKNPNNLKEEGTLVPDGSKNDQKDRVKQDITHLKHHLNAVPFTDEWVAAIETFGEEILELKTGPVQNSPPDKTLPEPGPWSPVKRKAQDIGPFDCTKHSTNLSSPSHSS